MPDSTEQHRSTLKKFTKGWMISSIHTVDSTKNILPHSLSPQSPAIQKHLEEIHKRLDDLLYAHGGLSKEYTITSVARDEEQIRHIPDASQHSAHLYGITFDLRSTGGDQRITHAKTGKIITLEGDDNACFHYALREVLDQMRSEGKIFVIIEQSPAHFHIQSRIQEDATWILPHLRERIKS